MTSTSSEGGPDFLELLDQFNRKERYFLVCGALGLDRFSLSEEFRDGLGTKLNVTIPTDARVWMDYHLSWLAAAVAKWHEPLVGDVYPNDTKLVRGNQEDLDLLVAFKEVGLYRLVLIEAKAYEDWDDNQASSKAKRLEGIFGSGGCKYPGLKVHYCLMSPCPPKDKDLNYADWPGWMKRDGTYVWLKLPVSYPRLEVNRWDADRGKESASGEHFHIKQIVSGCN